MDALPLLVSNSQAAAVQTYVDDVFSAYPYTGTGASLTITNGIDLAGNGGMVWLKDRTSANTAFIMDTNRGVSSTLQPSTISSAGTVSTAITAFNNNGFTLGTNTNINTNANKYIGWTFRKAPKFFGIVTYTGNGTTQTLAHNLGIAPGMIVVKKLSSSSGVGWDVWHRSLTSGSHVWLNRTDAETASGASSWGNNSVVVDPTSTDFTVGQNVDMNANGATYVAYLFAHNAAADGLIQCGTVTIGSSDTSVTLGWEPQYILMKRTDAVGDWVVFDTMRELGASQNEKVLKANLGSAEASYGALKLTASGFNATTAFGIGTTYIYMAIRRSNKPPTTGTQVFNAIARTGTGAAATVTGVGFAPDAVISCSREPTGQTNGVGWQDRLRGTGWGLRGNQASADLSVSDAITAFGVDGFSLGADTLLSRINASAWVHINWCLRRSVGVFDIVCYAGTGEASQTITHGLGVVPELIITKNRTAASSWWTYNAPRGKNFYISLESENAEVSSANIWGTSGPSTTTFDVNSALSLTTSANNYVAYLFATKAGISKVGSYTGNGTSINIDCGFTAGARFVLIKCTNTTGDWYVWDTVRGIVAGNDPHLSLNAATSEVTTNDTIDPLSAGFTVNQVAATNINVSAATYIYLAFA